MHTPQALIPFIRPNESKSESPKIYGRKRNYPVPPPNQNSGA